MTSVIEVMMSKRSINEANQRVAMSRVIEVSGESASLAEAIQALLDQWNSAADRAFAAGLAAKGGIQRWASSGAAPGSRHYFLLQRSDHLWVTFGVRALRVAERGFNPNDRGWLAVVTPEENGADRKIRIMVTLAKWSVNDRRLMWNGGRYIQLLDGLVAGLDGRYVSAPVDENDHHFISQVRPPRARCRPVAQLRSGTLVLTSMARGMGPPARSRPTRPG
jgi:hypothetical protein